MLPATINMGTLWAYDEQFPYKPVADAGESSNAPGAGCWMIAMLHAMQGVAKHVPDVGHRPDV